jgi:hypothetical protein
LIKELERTYIDPPMPNKVGLFPSQNIKIFNPMGFLYIYSFIYLFGTNKKNFIAKRNKEHNPKASG